MIPNERDLRSHYDMPIDQPFRVGQTVALIDRISGFVNTFRIEKRTPTGLLRVYDALYSADGFRKGAGGSERRIVPITPEIKRLIEHRDLRRALARRMAYEATEGLSLDTLHGVQALLDAARPTAPTKD